MFDDAVALSARSPGPVEEQLTALLDDLPGEFDDVPPRLLYVVDVLHPTLLRPTRWRLDDDFRDHACRTGRRSQAQSNGRTGAPDDDATAPDGGSSPSHPSAAAGGPAAAGSPAPKGEPVVGSMPARAGDDGVPELARCLDAGVAALERAGAQSTALAVAAAARAVALAEFARARPSLVFDRQPGERGAASAATRAARPASLTAVSEWAVDEVSTALHLSGREAEVVLDESLVLVERLPGTLAALAAGRLSYAHARRMIAIVGRVADDAVRADIEATVLRLLRHKTPADLARAARRVVLRKDAEAAARTLAAAIRDRGVRLLESDDGMGALDCLLPLPVATAVYRALEAYAEQCLTDGDERTKPQRMADCLVDLILRPAESDHPPVTIALTLVATLETMLGGDQPGEVDGKLVPADLVRELGYTFGLMPRPAPRYAGPSVPETTQGAADPQEAEASRAGADENRTPRAEPLETRGSRAEADESPTHDRPPHDDQPHDDQPREPEPHIDPPDVGSPDATSAGRATDTPGAELAWWMARARAADERAHRDGLSGAGQAIVDGVWTDGELRRVLDLGALLDVRDLTGTGLAHRPRIAVVDRLRGTLVALTDATAIRRGEALGPPPDTAGYTPGRALDRFVRERDRRCIFPGCRARPQICDLDHKTPYPQGPTAHWNLGTECEHHHRLKHQAPGWEVSGTGDGGTAVSTPSGKVLVSYPTGYGEDDSPPPF